MRRASEGIQEMGVFEGFFRFYGNVRFSLTATLPGLTWLCPIQLLRALLLLLALPHTGPPDTPSRVSDEDSFPVCLAAPPAGLGVLPHQSVKDSNMPLGVTFAAGVLDEIDTGAGCG